MSDVLLSGGQLFIDGELVTADLLVRDGRIAEIGTNIEAGDVPTFDVTGRTVLPGLIDTHVHVLVDGMDMVARLSEPHSLPYFRAAKVLTETLSRGITTIRDAGWADLGIKRAVETGLIDGPDMRIAISILGETGGHSDMVTPTVAHPTVREVTPWSPDTIVDGKDEMRKRVRELARAGADTIKLCTTGGVSSPNDDPRHSQFTRGEIKTAVKEAAKHEMSVMAHAQGKQGILNAIQCGVRSIEHGIYADQECFDEMKARGVWLVPTLIAPVALNRAIKNGMRVPEGVAEKSIAVTKQHQAMFVEAVKAGVRVAFGSDAGVFQHVDSLEELGLMQAGGMTPAEVLQAATASSAELMKLDDRGRLAVGLRADLAIVNGDPYDFTDYGSRMDAVFVAGAQRR